MIAYRKFLRSAFAAVGGLTLAAAGVACLVPVASAAVDDGPVGGVTILGDANGRRKVEAFGFADRAQGVKFDADTVCWIASNTKGIAAATVLTCVDDGLIALDDPVSKYLPEFKDLKVKEKDGTVRPAKTVMTIRHVLSHTSGLEFFPGWPIDARPMRLLAQEGAKSFLWTDPGTGYRYSNWGIDVAVAIVEAVTGRPWEERLQKRILDPLEMKDTTFWPNGEQMTRLAKGYQLKDGAEPREVANVQVAWPLSLHSRFAEAGGGLYSTANDLYKFARMIANRGWGVNTRILSEKIMKEWFAKQTPEGVPNKYSFGMDVNPEQGRIGHGGAWRTNLSVDWKNGTLRVYVVQVDSPNATSKKHFDDFIAAAEKAQAKEPVEWTDGLDLPVEGRAFPLAELARPYDRLPIAYSNELTSSVWWLMQEPAGEAFRFRTASKRLRVQYLLGAKPSSSPHNPATNKSGVDVYQKTADKGWQYVPPKFPQSQPLENGCCWDVEIEPGAETLVYLPTYNLFESIRFGVEPGTTIEPLKAPSAKPVVIYGTSITQGGCGSRPGMAWPAVVGREANVEVVNLGFSGSGCMELVLAKHLANIDASLYVLDNICNMTPDLTEQRFEPFLRYLREKRPMTPIVVTKNAWCHYPAKRRNLELMQATVAKLQKEDAAKWAKVIFAGLDPAYDDEDFTVDGLHLADYGMMTVGKLFAKEFLSVLEKETKR